MFGPNLSDIPEPPQWPWPAPDEQLREENKRLRTALALALEYAKHDEGCSRVHGEEYRCRCRWVVAKAEIEALTAARPAAAREAE